MREQLAAKPQSGSHPSSPVALLHQALPYAESPQCPQRLPGMEEVCAILDFAMHYDRQRIAVGIMVLLLTGIRQTVGF